MAAYRRVDDLSHLQVDCLYTGISSGSTLGNEYGKPLPFYQVATSPSCLVTPCGGECIRPLRVLGRHIRPWQEQCTHVGTLQCADTCPPSKVPLPMGYLDLHLIHDSLQLHG